MSVQAAHEGDAQRLRDVLELAAQFYADHLADSLVAKRWMTTRGWESLTAPGPDASRWRPGYAPRAWTALTDHLRARGTCDADLVDSGLGLVTRRGTTVDRFRNRIVFPLVDERGVTGFVGRVLPGSGDQAPKWLNPPHTSLYDKASHLFGLAQNVDRWTTGQQPVLVEGPGDAIAVGLAGRAAVALCGTALTAQHTATLDRALHPGRGLLVAFDGDTAGRAAVDRAWTHLAGRPGVRVVELAEGRDPGGFAAAQNLAGLRAALSAARPLREVVIDHRLDRWSNVLDSVGGQVEAVRHVAALLVADPSEAEKSIAYLSRRLGQSTINVRSVVLDEIAPPHIGRLSFDGTRPAIASSASPICPTTTAGVRSR